MSKIWTRAIFSCSFNTIYSHKQDVPFVFICAMTHFFRTVIAIQKRKYCLANRVSDYKIHLIHKYDTTSGEDNDDEKR